MGYRLVLVTARQQRELERSLQWLEKHFPGIFDWMICTGQSQETLTDEKELVTKLSKADVSLTVLCFSLSNPCSANSRKAHFLTVFENRCAGRLGPSS